MTVIFLTVEKMLSTEQRTFVVSKMCEASGRYTSGVQQCFALQFGAQPPHRTTAANLYRKFLETGSVADRPRSGRPQVPYKTKMLVQERMMMSPSTSTRRLSQILSIPKSTIHDVLKKDLGMHAYKIRKVHQLKEHDARARLDFCYWLSEFVHRDEDALEYTFFSDEAWFHLSGYVNNQVNRVWSSENPHALHETPLHDMKIGVWCALSRKRIIGPIFFEETINADRYKSLILEPFIAELDESEIQCAWFQQDGATAHTAKKTLAFLEEFFADRIISKGLWPPRSPDLNPLDFYLWGSLKGKVYRNRPRTLAELKAAITDEVNQISEEELGAVMDNLLKRIDVCIKEKGAHFQHLV